MLNDVLRFYSTQKTWAAPIVYQVPLHLPLVVLSSRGLTKEQREETKEPHARLAYTIVFPCAVVF